VGLRHQEHKRFGELQVERFPSREVGARIPGEGFPVLAYHTIGVPGWVLPHVAILDWFGLNDVVIAHARPMRATSEERQMAHDRGPPEGYLDCFRPNVFVLKKYGFSVRPRARPLTADEIRACEARFLEVAQ
jgi:arabinofuranosyltransferase